ncbi:hypothetical protein ACFXO9_31375 [Nocardia tengchongensis]|uniref:hypothetical protein n=1 Tax=Nocardia tengchongensis TaxID=2055889 RepID=UPI00368031D0
MGSMAAVDANDINSTWLPIVLGVLGLVAGLLAFIKKSGTLFFALLGVAGVVAFFVLPFVDIQEPPNGIYRSSFNCGSIKHPSPTPSPPRRTGDPAQDLVNESLSSIGSGVRCPEGFKGTRTTANVVGAGGAVLLIGAFAIERWERSQPRSRSTRDTSDDAPDDRRPAG